MNLFLEMSVTWFAFLATTIPVISLVVFAVVVFFIALFFQMRSDYKKGIDPLIDGGAFYGAFGITVVVIALIYLPIPCLILLILAGVFGLFMAGLVKLAKKGTRYSS